MNGVWYPTLDRPIWVETLGSFVIDRKVKSED